jgi:hypothetical protein
MEGAAPVEHQIDLLVGVVGVVLGVRVSPLGGAGWELPDVEVDPGPGEASEERADSDPAVTVVDPLHDADAGGDVLLVIPRLGCRAALLDAATVVDNSPCRNAVPDRGK